MRSLIVASLLGIAACSPQTPMGDPTWGTVTGTVDRGGWGCFTSVKTDAGMLLTRKGCAVQAGERLCVQAMRRPVLGEPAHFYWDPSGTCKPDPNPPEAP